MDVLTLHGLHFQHGTDTGVLFFMIGAVSQYGKVGVVCVGDSREAADRLYEHTVDVLDRETGADRELHGQLAPIFDSIVTRME
jgi:hypothetical protein